MAGPISKVTMAVAAFPREPDRLVGGVEAASMYLSRALAGRADVDLTVLVVGPGAEDWIVPPKHPPGIRLELLRTNQRLPRFFQTFVDAPRRIREYVRQEGGVFHVQGIARWAEAAGPAGIAMLYGIAEKDILYRSSFLSRWLGRALLGWFESRSRPRVAQLILTSPYIREFLTPTPEQRIWEVGNPIADSFFTVPRCVQPGRLFCGATLCERKNIKGLIEAFRQVAAHHPHLVLRLGGAGVESRYGQECRQQAAAIGLADRIQFLGALAVAEVQAELAAAEVMVLPSFQETAPLIISEAMAVGVPVAASRICGIPAMVSEGASGRLFDPTRPDAIAACLIALLREDNLEAMSAAARQTAAQRYRASAVAETLAGAYRETLDRAGRRRPGRDRQPTAHAAVPR